MKKGWKVTIGRVSTSAPWPARRIYKEGTAVVPHPNCGPLFVFAAFEAAKYYADALATVEKLTKHVRVFECEWLPWDRPLPRSQGRPLVFWCGDSVGTIAFLLSTQHVRLARLVKVGKTIYTTNPTQKHETNPPQTPS